MKRDPDEEAGKRWLDHELAIADRLEKRTHGG
jgi:hypothetical protein